ADAGKILALFHKLLQQYQPEYEPSQGSYHAARSVAASMEAIPHTLAKVDPRSVDQGDRVSMVVKFLHSSYNIAAMKVNDMGLATGRCRSFTATGTRATCCSAARAWSPSSTTTPPASSSA